MKTLFVLASMVVVLFLADPNKIEAQKRKAAKTIEGTISGYECGDNCYLTITDKIGKQHTGLCTAHPLCTKWNREVMMPANYKGKRVKVTVGKGTLLTGSGGVVGTMDAFTRIQFIEPETIRAQDGDTAVIDKFLSKQESPESGYEYKDARKVIAGDLNRDGVPDLAVLYTIEGARGANNYAQLLAAFIRTKDGLLPVTHTVVGGKGIRSVELQSITDNMIFFKTLNYGPKDPACCPSKKGTTRFVLVNRRLKER